MSYNYDISNLLNLKDKNIFFKDSCVSEEPINNVLAKVFNGVLTYTPSKCPNCGHEQDGRIIKYGFKTTLIKLPPVSGFAAYLRLKKQRCFCQHCRQTFTLKTTIVQKHCSISNLTKIAITIDLKHKISEKDLASNYNVSSNSVMRTVDGAFNLYRPSPDYLPMALCFDEFKSVKSAKGAMSFIFCDANTSEIIDIVEDRRLSVLMRYFSRFTKAARHGVKFIVIDLYSPYMTRIKKCFPRAKIIIDRFHMIQLLSRALNQTRIQVMKDRKEDATKFKKFWRLFLKDASAIDEKHRYYQPTFKSYRTNDAILKALLAQDKTLAASYDFYQTLLFAVKKRNTALLLKTIHGDLKALSPAMITAAKTLRKQEEHILNSLTHPYHNGRIEGLNNKIKVIKRIAFGYKSFFHFRNRILITQGILKLKAA